MKKRINVILDTDTHLALKVYAAQVGSSMSDVAWEAIRMYLQSHCESGSEKSWMNACIAEHL